MKSKVKIRRDTRQFVNQAWVRNGELFVTGEPLILALLLHTTGGDRGSDNMKTVKALMNDINTED